MYEPQNITNERQFSFPIITNHQSVILIEWNYMPAADEANDGNSQANELQRVMQSGYDSGYIRNRRVRQPAIMHANQSAWGL